MFEGNDSVLNSDSVPSKLSYKSFRTLNLPLQNTSCDHRNFDSVNLSLDHLATSHLLNVRNSSPIVYAVQTLVC